jgi:hypothetical protein
MSAPQQPGELSKALNRLQQLAPAPLNRSSSLHSQMSQSPGPTGWSSQSPSLPPNAVPAPAFTHFSATTAEILNRIKAGSSAHTTGTPAFEAKRAEVLQNYMTSDKLPTPPPITNNSRRGRGGRIGTSSHLKTDASESPAAGATPTSGRGSGRGRPRGRGRGGGRGGKRKRSESFDDSEVSGLGALELLCRCPMKTNSARTTRTYLCRTLRKSHEQSLDAMSTSRSSLCPPYLSRHEKTSDEELPRVS